LLRENKKKRRREEDNIKKTNRYTERTLGGTKNSGGGVNWKKISGIGKNPRNGIDFRTGGGYRKGERGNKKKNRGLGSPRVARVGTEIKTAKLNQVAWEGESEEKLAYAPRRRRVSKAEGIQNLSEGWEM